MHLISLILLLTNLYSSGKTILSVKLVKIKLSLEKKKMKRNWNIVTLCVILVICNIGTLHAADNVTQKVESTAAPAATTKAPEATTPKVSGTNLIKL